MEWKEIEPNIWILKVPISIQFIIRERKDIPGMFFLCLTAGDHDLDWNATLEIYNDSDSIEKLKNLADEVLRDLFDELNQFLNRI